MCMIFTMFGKYFHRHSMPETNALIIKSYVLKNFFKIKR